MSKTSRQLTTHLARSERVAFEAYAQGFHLDPAALLALLFARELRIGRFRELLEKDEMPDVSKETKVTVRLKPADHMAISDQLLPQCESLSQAGGVLIRAELSERWLERVCSTLFESHEV